MVTVAAERVLKRTDGLVKYVDNVEVRPVR
jgi:hypothetical protein